MRFRLAASVSLPRVGGSVRMTHPSRQMESERFLKPLGFLMGMVGGPKMHQLLYGMNRLPVA